jgi:hypothetical protein
MRILPIGGRKGESGASAEIRRLRLLWDTKEHEGVGEEYFMFLSDVCQKRILRYYAIVDKLRFRTTCKDRHKSGF